MYLSTHKKKVKDKIYISYSLRTSYRDTKGKVRHKHIANLPKCTDEEIKALRLALTFKGKLEELGSIEDISITNESSFGGTYVLYQVAKKLGIEKVLGNSKNGKLALWQIIARILGRGSRLSAKRMMSKYSADHILDLEEVDKNMLYKNLDWLEENQEAIEKKLWELRGGKKIDLYLYDVTSSYLEGSCNELATYGYNRDKKKGKEQIVVGLLTDDEGFPVAARVFEGNTSDSKTIQKQIEILRDKFGCKNVTLVGDRGMLKTPQIDALPKGFNYITGIGKPTIKKLEKEGIFQYSLFDKEIHEISHNDIRYIMRSNPLIAEESAEWRRGRIASIVKLVEEKNKYLIDKPRASIGAAVKAVEKLVDKYNGSFPFSKMHFSLHQRIAGILRQVFANFVRGYTIAPPIINFGHLIFAKFNKFLHSSLGVGSFKILLSLLSTFKTHKFVNTSNDSSIVSFTEDHKLLILCSII